MIIYNFFKYLYLHIRYNILLNEIYKHENLISNLSKLFGHEFKKDWVGRIYTVINPYIVNGQFNNDYISEVGDDGSNQDAFIEQYVMQKLAIAEKFIYSNNLFDLLTYKIIRLDNYDNYLFVMKPLTYDNFIKWSKAMIVLLAISILLLIMFLLYTN